MSWVGLTEGSAVLSADVNGNFQHVALGSLLPRANSATMDATTGVYNVGTSTVYWRGVYLNNFVGASQTINVSGSMLINGTVSVQYLRCTATANIGNFFYESGTAISSGRTTDQTFFANKLWLTSGEFLSSVTVAHGLTNGASRIHRVWVGVWASTSVDTYSNAHKGGWLYEKEADAPDTTQTSFYGASFDDTSIHLNSTHLPSASVDRVYYLKIVASYTQ